MQHGKGNKACKEISGAKVCTMILPRLKDHSSCHICTNKLNVIKLVTCDNRELMDISLQRLFCCWINASDPWIDHSSVLHLFCYAVRQLIIIIILVRNDDIDRFKEMVPRIRTASAGTTES